MVVAHDIAPADMLRLRGGRFAAFVTDLGGPTSHTAIVARSMGVPAVVAMGNVRELVRDGDMLIIDGAAGAVVVNPSDRILQEYRRRQAAYADERAELGLLRDEPSVTLDGIDIVLHANIELPEETALALASGAHLSLIHIWAMSHGVIASLSSSRRAEVSWWMTRKPGRASR